MKTLFINHANSILEVGDYIYNEIKNSFNRLDYNLLLPTINSFIPFLQRDIPCLDTYENKRKESIISLIKDCGYNKLKPTLKLIKGSKKD